MATPTYATALSQINTFIVSNGNNEITANVLNPVLKVILDFANNNIGDLDTLTTGEKNSVVEAINSLKQNFEDLVNNGIQLHTGYDDPNVTPPADYNYGDFYMQLDSGDDSPIKLWQWNGFEWKDSSNNPATNSDNVENNSDVEGENVTEALNNLYPGEIVTEADFIATVEADGTIAKIDPVNLPWILKDDFYKNTDVNYPADITFRPFKITEQNGIFKTDFGVDDIVKDKISKMKAYYCNYETGSNSNDGLTPVTAVKTITYAYVTLGARLVYLTGGIHKSDSWGSLNSSFANTDDFFVLQYGDKETFVTNSPASAPSYSLQSGTTYQYTLSATANVIDMKYRDKKGFPYRMTLQTSIANVNANAGSFYISGSNVYINTLDGRVPDSSILSLRGGIDTATYNANAGYHYVRGINFMGGSLENGTHGVNSQISSSSTLVSLSKDCKFMYGQDTGYDNNGGEGSRNVYNKFNLFEGCIAYGNSRDGYNYLADTSNKMFIVEINCQSFQNGERMTSNSVNGSSAHNVCEVIRINGKYYQNSGPNIADVDGAITVNYGVTCFNSIAPAASTNVDFSTSSSNSNISRQYNYKVKSYNASRAFTIVNTFESHIINKDVVYKGVNVIATPGAPQTITFSDFPTENVVSPALPALSAYTAKIEYAPNILTGYVSGAGTVAGTDTVLQAIQKLNGNIALGTRPYKTYSGTITQAGTGNPTFLVDENQLSGALAWTRTGVGVYTGTLAGAFTSSKIRINISNNLNSTPNQQILAQKESNDTIVFQSFIGAVLTDSVLNQMFFEVRVYP